MRFASIHGHAELKDALRANIQSDRIAHTQYFLGPTGSGNLALALAYSRYLLCQDRGIEESCGVCTSCLNMDKLTHPDLHLSFPVVLSKKNKILHSDHKVEAWREAVLQQPYLNVDRWHAHTDEENKQSVIGVDDAANLVRKLILRSYLGAYRIALIWLPERMNPAAANKLLKIIEEPPGKVLFLLVGHDHERLLPTILSRTQMVKVPALEQTDVARAVMNLYELDEQKANAIAARSEGDLLKAMNTVEESEEDLMNFFRDWMRACYKGSVLENNALGDVFQKLGREKQMGLLRYGLYFLRQCLLITAGTPELVLAMGDEKAFAMKFAPLMDETKIDQMRGHLEKAHQHLRRNANPRILFMDMSFGISAAFRGEPMLA